MTSDVPVYRVCGVSVAALNAPDAATYLVDRAREGARCEVHLCNAYTLSLVDRDERLQHVLQTADLNLSDGTPLAWLGRKEGLRGPVRGPGLVGDVFRAGVSAGISHYLYGGASQDVTAGVERTLHAHAPGARIVGTETPPFRDLDDAELDALGERITASGADIVWIGIGTPRQDYLVSEVAARTGVVVIPVGAAFDFWSGHVPEAPAIVRGSGLEWAYRLAKEPRRLWRRYLVGNPRFVATVVRHRLRRRS